ncbi:nucleotide-diphospho-sugar transferase [Flammula alnicola]|nr:nucleotide-diphospho-sugar transferase [Flammula alnicola]
MAAKSASSGKDKLIDEEEEVLQAVILADSFNKRFRPLTTRKPRCLLPICNAPLLDWTFESLALAGVQEVFVICRSHAELVKDAIKESKWSKPGSGMKIVPIMTAKETFSPGDAMRDIYTRGLVTTDFVLVMGDLVSNVRIDEVVRVHKERRRTNKDAIMTMVVKESGERHRTRARGESAVFVLDPATSECLHYEHVQGYPRTKGINIPREILEAHPEVDIRNDLLDCSIDVCSVEVPSLFQDNFDYLDIRRDFVHGILTSDILMKNIYCYVAEEGYAARVQDTRSYDSISKDILSRWTFPLVPDDNHPGGHVYEYTRGNRYIAKDNTVVLARTCNVGKNTLIGSSTTVSDNVTITASVIGQNCRIGAGSTINNSYIFENAVVGEGCSIERSIIGAGVQIKDRSRIPKGCLIADGVVVGPDATLRPFERLSVRRDEADIEADADDDDSDIEEVEANQDSIDKVGLGKDSNAIVWPRGPPADEEDDEEGPENYRNQRFMRIGDNASDLDISDGASSDSDVDSDEDESDAFDVHATDRDSISGHSDLSLSMHLQPLDGTGAGGLMADAEFRTEVTQSLERAFAEGHSVDNAAVELKTLRMASNVPLTRVKEAVVAGIVERIPVVEGDAAVQRKEIANVVGRWGDLINRIGGVDPVETVSLLQAHCASSTRMPLFGQILAALYQEDIVEEDDIRAWHALPASKAEDRKPGVETDNLQKCWMIGSHMIQQFDAQESDSESEEEEEEEEEKKPVPKAAAASTPSKPAAAPPAESSSEESEEEKKPAPKAVAASTPSKPSAAPPAESSSEESDGSEEEEESSQANTHDEESDDGTSDAVSASEDSTVPSTNPSTNVSDDEESEHEAA